MTGSQGPGRCTLSRVRRGTRIGLAVVLAAAALALAACSSASPQNDDAAYGIPPGIVAPSLMRPDGLMINGLLPPQPGDMS